MIIKSPRSNPDHANHILDCEEAIEKALAELKLAAQDAGWARGVVARAVLNLAKAEVSTISDGLRLTGKDC